MLVRYFFISKLSYVYTYHIRNKYKDANTELRTIFINSKYIVNNVYINKFKEFQETFIDNSTSCNIY